MLAPKTIKDFDDNFKECDVVLFTGGADVGPHLYGENVGQYTFCDQKRDKFEYFVAKRAMDAGKPMLGICRGAQFVCVMAGGRLVQHTENHGYSHMITDIFGNAMMMTSTHHQMMIPTTAEEHLVIAKTAAPKSGLYLNGDNKALYQPFAYDEPEIVWFPKIKALAIQGHPEVSSDADLHKYCCDLIEFYIFNQQDTKQPHYPTIIKEI